MGQIFEAALMAPMRELSGQRALEHVLHLAYFVCNSGFNLMTYLIFQR